MAFHVNTRSANAHTHPGLVDARRPRAPAGTGKAKCDAKKELVKAQGIKKKAKANRMAEFKRNEMEQEDMLDATPTPFTPAIPRHQSSPSVPVSAIDKSDGDLTDMDHPDKGTYKPGSTTESESSDLSMVPSDMPRVPKKVKLFLQVVKEGRSSKVVANTDDSLTESDSPPPPHLNPKTPAPKLQKPKAPAPSLPYQSLTESDSPSPCNPKTVNPKPNQKKVRSPVSGAETEPNSPPIHPPSCSLRQFEMMLSIGPIEAGVGESAYAGTGMGKLDDDAQAIGTGEKGKGKVVDLRLKPKVADSRPKPKPKPKLADSKPKLKIANSKAKDKDIGTGWRTWKARNMDIEANGLEILDDDIDDKSTRGKKPKLKAPIAMIVQDDEMNNGEDCIELSDQQEGKQGSASGGNKKRGESDDTRLPTKLKSKLKSTIKEKAIDGIRASKHSHDDSDK